MRTRWIGIAGMLALLTSLVLNIAGPRWFPAAFWGTSDGVMSGGMMGSGMMNGGMMGGALEDDANLPFDQRFLDQMILHHQQGVMMAQHMIADSERPEMRDLAQRIISTQQREIDQMRPWRRAWYGTAAAENMQEAMLEQMKGSGMMNRDQMRQMMGANMDMDRMFLDMMIPHHEEAIAMAEQAMEQAEHPEITTLAQNIITTQRAEIDEMRGYLRAWYDISSG